jgi:hypothetical protein
MSIIDISELETHFELVRYDCAGVDRLICKIHLRAR